MVAIIYPFKKKGKFWVFPVLSSLLVDVIVLKCEAQVIVIVGVLQYS